MLKSFPADATIETAVDQTVISQESGAEIPPPVWPVPRLPRRRNRKESAAPPEIESIPDDELSTPGRPRKSSSSKSSKNSSKSSRVRLDS